MQTLQLGTGLDADLLDEDATGLAVDLERLGLPPAAIQREHQLRREPLARRVLGQQLPQLAHQRGVPAGARDRPPRAPPAPPAAAPPAARSPPARTARTPTPPAAARATARAPRAAAPPPARAARAPARAAPPPRHARSARRRARPGAPAAGSPPAWSRSPRHPRAPCATARRSTCTVLAAPAGASSPHSATASRSALTGSFACNNNTASTARGLNRPAPPHRARRAPQVARVSETPSVPERHVTAPSEG